MLREVQAERQLHLQPLPKYQMPASAQKNKRRVRFRSQQPENRILFCPRNLLPVSDLYSDTRTTLLRRSSRFLHVQVLPQPECYKRGNNLRIF